MTRLAAAVLVGCLALAGCGVGDEPEPVPLTEAPVPAGVVPTVTERPDPARAPATTPPVPTTGG